MNFNIVNSLMLLGAIQGIIFGVVILLSKKYRSQSIYYLTAMMLAIVYNSLQYYISDIWWLSMDFIWKTIYLPLGSLIPAFIYFYVVTSLDKERKISKKEKLLYLPFLVFFLITVFFKLQNAMGLWNENSDVVYGALLNLHEVISFLFLFIILLLCLNKILRFEKKLKVFDLAFIKPRLNWLIGILSLLLLINLVYGYMIYVMYTNPNEIIGFYAVWILETFLIYFLGHMGIYKFGIHEERKKIRTFAKEHRSFSIVEKPKNEHISAFENLLINERKFLDSEITLESVADELNISKGHLSRVINAELDTSFSDYINSLRVEEAKSYLKNSEFSNYTLVAIGLEAGFNSKSTFNSVFKKIAGSTPSEFKKAASN